MIKILPIIYKKNELPGKVIGLSFLFATKLYGVFVDKYKCASSCPEWHSLSVNPTLISIDKESI